MPWDKLLEYGLPASSLILFFIVWAQLRYRERNNELYRKSREEREQQFLELIAGIIKQSYRQTGELKEVIEGLSDVVKGTYQTMKQVDRTVTNMNNILNRLEGMLTKNGGQKR